MAREGAAAASAPDSNAAPAYARHRRPEHTLLYRLIEQHYPAFLAQRAAEERPLPRYVPREFEAYLKCGRLEYGFLRVRCDTCHAEQLVAFSSKKRGFCPSCGARRMSERAALLVEQVLPTLTPLRSNCPIPPIAPVVSINLSDSCFGNNWVEYTTVSGATSYELWRAAPVVLQVLG